MAEAIMECHERQWGGCAASRRAAKALRGAGSVLGVPILGEKDL